MIAVPGLQKPAGRGLGGGGDAHHWPPLRKPITRGVSIEKNKEKPQKRY